MKECGEWTITVLIYTFNRRTMVLPNMETGRCGFKRFCWILAAPFSTMRYINNVRTWMGDTTGGAPNQLSQRQNRVLFRHKESWIEGSDYTRFQAITLRANYHIFVVQEQSVECGRDYICTTTVYRMDTYSFWIKCITIFIHSLVGLAALTSTSSLSYRFQKL